MQILTRSAVSLLAIVMAHPAAVANGQPGVGMGPFGVDFSLFVERADSDWRFSDADRETRRDMIGVRWAEPLAPGLAGGVSLGYIGLTQAGDPLLAGRELGGYFVGINLFGALLQGRRITLTGEVDYTYHEVDDRDEAQRVEMQWHAAGVGLGARAPLGPGLALLAGARYGLIDGELLASGSLDDTRTFEEQRRETYLLGLEAAVQDGRVAVSWRGGQSRGFGLSFQRRF